MTTNEVLTLIALIFGPLCAVLITLWSERRRRETERKIDVLRRLIISRHLPADPTFLTAINLVPIEFNKNVRVINAFKEFIDAARVRLDGVNNKDIVENTTNKTTRLVYEVASDLGFKLRETDIQTTAYASTAWEQNIALAQDSQKAMRDVANILFLQLQIVSGRSADELRGLLVGKAQAIEPPVESTKVK